MARRRQARHKREQYIGSQQRMSSLLLDSSCLGELIPNDYSYLAREEACKTASRNLRQHASSFLASRLREWEGLLLLRSYNQSFQNFLRPRIAEQFFPSLLWGYFCQDDFSNM